MNFKEMAKSVEKYTLTEPITADELFALMSERMTAELPGKFKLKKGLFGKSIAFDVYQQVMPSVSVKGNVVKVQKLQISTGVSIGGGPAIDIKATQQRIAAAKEGGFKSAMFGGHEYFIKVCDALREALADRLA